MIPPVPVSPTKPTAPGNKVEPSLDKTIGHTSFEPIFLKKPISECKDKKRIILNSCKDVEDMIKENSAYEIDF